MSVRDAFLRWALTARRAAAAEDSAIKTAKYSDQSNFVTFIFFDKVFGAPEGVNCPTGKATLENKVLAVAKVDARQKSLFSLGRTSGFAVFYSRVEIIRGMPR